MAAPSVAPAAPAPAEEADIIRKPLGPKPYKYVGHSTWKAYWRKVQEERAMSLYRTDPTIAEAAVALHQMEKNDIVFTLIHRYGIFNQYNWKEFAVQVADWREKKCVALPCNVRELVLQNWEGQGGKCYMMVIQPPDIQEAPMCPLAIACGMLVNGYTYIFKNKEDVDRVLAALK